MPPGVILAAGDSTRMGSPKALLLTPDGRTFVAAIAETFTVVATSIVWLRRSRAHVCLSLPESRETRMHLVVSCRLS
jgi:CTP:molybdopterin cytidylyltransferase MocA